MEQTLGHELDFGAVGTIAVAWLLCFVLVVGCGVVLLFVPLLHKRHGMQQDIARLDREIAQQDALENKQKQKSKP